jgi:hypothetical protein
MISGQQRSDVGVVFDDEHFQVACIEARNLADSYIRCMDDFIFII